MAYTTIDNPELYFQCKIFTGNPDDGDHAVTLDGSEDMQPDLVWGKCRDVTYNHELYDSVRGATKRLKANATSAEDTNAEYLKSFDSDGFTLGNASNFNYELGDLEVAWCWNTQGGAGSSNTAGSTNTITTSVGTTQGFSISTYTGTGSAATIGHGLGATPELIICKKTSGTNNWFIQHGSLGPTKYFLLDLRDAPITNSTPWNDTAPTSTVFTLGTGSGVNVSSGTYVSYAWAPKQGFSKFGGYTGNGNADGAFVYLGFRPAFVLCKDLNNTSVQNWELNDNKRNPYNEAKNTLRPNATTVEDGTYNTCDLLSNGFKLRTSNDATNKVAYSFIYIAFAEAPFVNSNGVPCNAR